MPAPRWFGRDNLRGWMISLISVLIAALLIAGIAALGPSPMLAATDQSNDL